MISYKLGLTDIQRNQEVHIDPSDDCKSAWVNIYDRKNEHSSIELSLEELLELGKSFYKAHHMMKKRLEQKSDV